MKHRPQVFSSGAALGGAALAVSLNETMMNTGELGDRLVAGLVGGLGIATLFLLPACLLARLGRGRAHAVRCALIPMALLLSFVGWSLTLGEAVSASGFSPVLRAGVLAIATLSAFVLAPRLARRDARLAGAGAALVAATAGVLHLRVFPGLYPTFHSGCVATFVSGAGAAAGVFLSCGPRITRTLWSLGALALALIIIGLVPGEQRELRRLMLADGVWTREVLPYISPRPSPFPRGPLKDDPVRAILARSPLAPAVLDRQFPGREDWSVIVLTIDALRLDHTGLGRNGRSSTPNLDAFGQRSSVFRGARSTYPITAPSIYSLMTGCYPSAASQAASEGGVARLARQRGWRTAALISFEADFLGRQWPVREGFEIFENRSRRAREANERALAWWDSNPDERRFLWLHYFDVHAPYRPLPPERAPDGGSLSERYRAEVEDADVAFGRLVQELAKRGELDRTLIVVHADHGTEHGEHGGIGQTPALYRESIAVPLLVYVPGAKARVIDDPVDLTRVAPTITELLGWGPPPRAHGSSLAAHLIDDPPAESLGLPFALANWRSRYGWGRSWDMLVEGDWKLLVDRSAMVSRLFDLERDPEERVDLTNSEPARAANMNARLERLLSWTEAADPRSATAPRPPDESDREYRETHARLLAAMDARTRITHESGSPSGRMELGQLFDAALTASPDDETRCELLNLATFCADVLPETPGMRAGLTAESAPLRRASVAALVSRRSSASKAVIDPKLRVAAPELVEAWAAPAPVAPPVLEGPDDLLRFGSASAPGIDALIPFALYDERLPSTTRALLLNAARGRRDFGFLACRYACAIRPHLDSEEARALLVDLADLSPALGEPILRALARSENRGAATARAGILEHWGRTHRADVLAHRERRVSELRSRFMTGATARELGPDCRRLLLEFAKEDDGVADWGLGLECLHLLNADGEVMRDTLAGLRFPPEVESILRAQSAPRAQQVVFEFAEVRRPSRIGRARLTLKVRAIGGPWRGELLPRRVHMAVAVHGAKRRTGYPLLIPLPPGGLRENRPAWLSVPLPARQALDGDRPLILAAIEHGRILGHIVVEEDAQREERIAAERGANERPAEKR